MWEWRTPWSMEISLPDRPGRRCKHGWENSWLCWALASKLNSGLIRIVAWLIHRHSRRPARLDLHVDLGASLFVAHLVHQLVNQKHTSSVRRKQVLSHY